MNYFDKKGNLIGTDCYFCGKPVYKKKGWIEIPGPMYYFAHKKCFEGNINGRYGK